MFERFNEKARRAIFFARFEASQYGSSYIESEYLLLGVAREDASLMRQLVPKRFSAMRLREAVDRKTERKQRIPTSVEIPLTEECRRALKFAAEEADTLGHREVRNIHLILGILRVQECFAAILLRENGVTFDFVRSIVAKGEDMSPESLASSASALNTLNSFLGDLRTNSVSPGFFFARNGQFIDSEGNVWAGHDEIQRGLEVFLSPYAKRKAIPVIEEVRPGPPGTIVATVLWQNAVPSDRSISILRMGLVLAIENDEWMIVLAQATPIPFH